MKTVTELLRDADPLRHEPALPLEARQRLRTAIVAAADGRSKPAGRLRRRRTLVAASSLSAAAIVVVGLQMWARGGAAVLAAVRFELRLAESEPAPGLREAQIAGSERVVYLHSEVVVTNGDIVETGLIPGKNPSRFDVRVELNQAAAERMRKATSAHIGRPAAILIDGQVITAPIVRAPISTSAVISGDYTRPEAESIARGILIQ